MDIDEKKMQEKCIRVLEKKIQTLKEDSDPEWLYWVMTMPTYASEFMTVKKLEEIVKDRYSHGISHWKFFTNRYALKF